MNILLINPKERLFRNYFNDLHFLTPQPFIELSQQCDAIQPALAQFPPQKPWSGQVFVGIRSYLQVRQPRGTSEMSFLTTVSFFEVSMALLFVGCAERIVMGYAPVSMIGRHGWLLRSEIDE